MRKRGLSLISAMIVLGLFVGNAWAGKDKDESEGNWLSAGADLGNSRYQDDEQTISSRNVGSLTLKWTLPTTGDVVAHPAVEGNYLYFPDSAGFLYKVEKKTGTLVWKKPVSDYTGVTGDFARGTPAVAGNLLILGNQSGKFLQAFGQPPAQPAQVFAVDKTTGAKVWAKQIDSTPYSAVTTSAIVYNGKAYVGVTSNEELIAGFVPPEFGWQWQFRGSVVALDVATGAIAWKTYTVPLGYFGGGVWGSTGAIDAKNNQIFMAVGNNWAVPQSVIDCLALNQPPASCMSPDNHFDSVIALDLDTGKINWGARGLPYDAWNVGCGLVVPGVFTIAPNGNCPGGDPSKAGPDWDFAQGPMLLEGERVGAGQKSGKFWVFKRKSGELAWVTQVAPGGVTGGLQWGSSTDGKSIFVAAANSGTTTVPGSQPWTLKNGTSVNSGGWAALKVANGAVLWTTPDPLGSRSEAPVAAANDVVFGCNVDFTHGRMVAMDAGSGAIKWSYDSGGPCNAGASISEGMVFWGSGNYSGVGPKKLFAFGL